MSPAEGSVGKSYIFKMEKAESGFFSCVPGPGWPTFSITKAQTSVGRKSDNDIPLPYGAISGKHGTIIKAEDGCHYKDHSKNGTWLLRKNEEERLIKDAMVLLQADDILEFGLSERMFRLYYFES
ncbi:MAG: FHA domain-containing protein [Gemmatimonadota bacterium]|nr:FHA domain-containing protein [Gemmatimonadota bacterium]